MSAFIGDMTSEPEVYTEECGPETGEITMETQGASESTSQQTIEPPSTQGNLRHRMLQKTGLSQPQPKDDTVEYPADDQYGLFEQVSDHACKLSRVLFYHYFSSSWRITQVNLIIPHVKDASSTCTSKCVWLFFMFYKGESQYSHNILYCFC